MINLRDQQLLFLESIFKGAESEAADMLSQTIAETENMSSQEHIEIYRNGVLGGLIQALADTYPVCMALLGEDFFSAMSAHFIRQLPSESPDLSEFSPLFSEFIEGFGPASELLYLPDVARLEWHWHQIFHEADSGTLDFTKLAEIGDQDVVFQLVDAGRLMHSQWPVHKVWQVNQAEYEGEGNVDLDEGEVFMWIWRNEYEMRLDPVTEEEWKLLNALREQKPFSQVCEQLASGNEVDVVSLLPQFVERGWICDFSLI